MKKNLLFILSAIICCGMALNACSSSEKDYSSVEYLAVQIDNNSYWSIIDKEGGFIVKDEYDKESKISAIVDGVYWVQNNKGESQLYSVDNPKKPINDNVYKNVTVFVDGISLVSDGKNPVQIIDTDGNIVKTLPDDIIAVTNLFSNGMAVFMDINTQKTGAIDTEGNIVIDAKYDEMVAAGDDFILFAEKKAGKTDIVKVGKNNNVSEPLDFSKYQLRSRIFTDGYIAVQDKDADEPKIRFMNENGDIEFTIEKAAADNACDYFVKDGYVVFINKDDKYGVVNTKGEEVIRAKYEKLFNIGNGRFIAQKEREFGIIDAEDNTVIDFDYDDIMLYKLGDNYIVRDGSSFFAVTEKDEKAFKGDFNNININIDMPSVITYESPERLVNMILSKIDETSFNGKKVGTTAAQLAQDFDMTADEIGTGKSYFYQKLYDFGSNPRIYYNFDDNLVEAITHEEGSGWSRHRVVDGYKFNDTRIKYVSVNLNTYGTSFEKSELSQMLRKGLEDKGYKLSSQKADLYQKGNTMISVEEQGTRVLLFYYYPKSDASAATSDNTAEESQQANGSKSDAMSQTKVQNGNNDFAWLSTRLATPADIEGMSRADIRIMRNAIFAMHGYKFKDKQLAELFNTYSWYKPMYSDVTSRLNKIEQQNIAFLKKYE